jgi:hypothetical protein
MAQSIAASIKIIDEILSDLASGCSRIVGVNGKSDAHPVDKVASAPDAPKEQQGTKAKQKDKKEKKSKGPDDLSKKPWLKNVQPAAAPATPIEQADLRV